MSLPRTPSQTVGPYLALAMRWPDGPHVARQDAPGAIWIRGRVLDGAAQPIDDAVVETWQAAADGTFPAGPEPGGFRGFGRCTTDGDGRWAIRTVKPGAVRGTDGVLHAPHIAAAVFARGLLKPVWTRIYFEDEAERNAADPVLAALEEERRGSMLARRAPDGYTTEIHLQGAHETVFFDV